MTLPINPIKKKILAMLATGKITKEKICVVAGIHYPAFMNFLNRPTVSYITRKSLQLCGLINEKDVFEYNMWLTHNNMDKERRGGYRPRRKKKKAEGAKENSATSG